MQCFDMSKVSVLLSPFFGGGSFELFAHQQLGLHVIGNDKFKPLINFWRQSKRHRKAVCQEVERLGAVTGTKFKDLLHEHDARVPRSQQASNFFVLNRCSFDGKCQSYSRHVCNEPALQSALQRLRDLDLRDFEFFDCDFEDFLGKFPSESHTVTFLDPPYYLSKRNSTLYGFNGHLHKEFDHERLRKVLGSRRRWMMTYNNVPYIRELYKDYTIIDVHWQYSMGRKTMASEIVIVCSK